MWSLRNNNGIQGDVGGALVSVHNGVTTTESAIKVDQFFFYLYNISKHVQRKKNGMAVGEDGSCF